MNTITLYRVTVTWTGYGKLAEPYRYFRRHGFCVNAAERQGHDDGGRAYRLPAGFDVSAMVIRGDNRYWSLEARDGVPGLTCPPDRFIPLELADDRPVTEPKPLSPEPVPASPLITPISG